MHDGPTYGGYGGSSGSSGSNGSSGSVYKDSGVSVSGSYPSSGDANTHSAIEYDLWFSDEHRISEIVTAKLGYALPTAVMPPTRPGWTFLGWFTEKNGGGTKYYNADGTVALALDEYAVAGELKLYAHWELTDPSAADTIAVNGVGLVDGITQYGDGWFYDGTTGYVNFHTSDKRYVVTGNDAAGEFSLYLNCDCELVLSNLTINASQNGSASPVEVGANRSPVLTVEKASYLYGPKNYPAILIPGSGASLTIRDGGGTLTANGGANAPGIGGTVGTHTGSLNIEGGTIIAQGGEYAAGIGAARESAFGTVNISGGRVISTGYNLAAGIGGSEGSTGCSVKISGGEVTATGGDGRGAYGGGAGIGGGLSGSNCSVEISGGTIFAQGGYSAPGIGGGFDGTDCSVKISGGTVTATGSAYGAGIGAGDASIKGTDTGITVEISGGFVTARSSMAAGIGPGDWTTCGAITISGGTVYATTDNAAKGAKPIGKGRYDSAESVTITGGAIYVEKDDISPVPYDSVPNQVFPIDLDIGIPNSRVEEFELGTRRSGFENIYTNDDGILRLWLACSSGYTLGIRIKMEGEENYEHIFSFAVDDEGKMEVRDYLIVNEAIVPGDADDGTEEWAYTRDTRTLTLKTDAKISGISTNDTFHIVVPANVANVTLQGVTLVGRNEKYASTMIVTNTACTVTLAGDNELTATGQYAAGLEVASNAVVTLTGTGSLTAQGGQYGAGIGSHGGFPKPGKIVIAGGTITATGGEKAAGIGGGLSSNLTADNIEVTGGYVTANGGSGAAGLGSGNVGSVSGDKKIPEGAVKISGGTVVATKGEGVGNLGDLIMSRNGNSPTGADGSLVITGGSVVGRTGKIMPCPVDAEGKRLAGVVVSNLTAKAEAPATGLPAGYGASDIFADEDGTVCLWLPAVHTAAYPDEAYNFTVGGKTFKVRIVEGQTGFSVGSLVEPTELAVTSLMLSASGLKMVVKTDDADWLELNAKSLKVLASSTPAMQDGEVEELTPEVEINGDGTATLTFELDGTGARFFKVTQ